jgi:large subunit ribosomal protein L23
MSILDRIRVKSSKGGTASGGKEVPVKETEKKAGAVKSAASGGSASTMEAEPPKKAVKKAIGKKEKSEKVVKSKKVVKSRKVAKKDENIAHKILLENMISEKSTMLASENKYVFRVVKDAGKNQIREAVEGYYGVQVVGVNTIKIPAKKRILGRTMGWKKGFKKAVVTLKEGDTIAAVEGV